jgi:hypothetical protein
MVVANVGGITEIFCPAGANAIEIALEDPEATLARAHLPAFLAKGDGRGRTDRLSRRICESLTVLYQRNSFFRFAV